MRLLRLVFAFVGNLTRCPSATAVLRLPYAQVHYTRNHLQASLRSTSCRGIPTLIYAKNVTLRRRHNAYPRACLCCFACGRMSSRGSRIVEYHKQVPKPEIFDKNQTLGSFRFCGLASRDLLHNTNKFRLGAALPSCVIKKKPRKPHPLGINSRQFSRFLICVSFSKKATFICATIFLTLLSFPATKTPSPAIELRTFFPEFSPSKVSLRGLKKYAFHVR